MLSRLRDKNWYVKFSKCELWLESIFFLGHTVTKEGIMVNPAMIAAVHDLKKKQLHQLRFGVLLRASIVTLLMKLTLKKVSF